MSREIQLRPQTLLTCLLFAVIAAAACGRHDAKSEEKRILSEINRIAEEGHQRLTSDEWRGSVYRMHEASRFFPDRRDEISKEAEAVKKQFIKEIIDDRKIVGLYGELLGLPLSDSYRNCVTAQLELEQIIVSRSEKFIDEMDVLLDRSINDRQTLDARLAPIRQSFEELDRRSNEREASMRQICRPPESSQ